MLKKIKNWLFPKWKVTLTRTVVMEMQSLLFNKEWKETKVLEIQTSVDGRKRAFWLDENKKVKVDYKYICTKIGKDL